MNSKTKSSSFVTGRPVFALSESIDSQGLQLLSKSATVHEFSSLQELIQARKSEHTDAIIVRSITVDAASMEALPGLKVIGRHGAGLDNIDLDAAKARGIEVINTPHSNVHSVAEYVIGAIYTLLKKFGETSAALRNNEFSTEAGSLPGQVHRLGLAGRELSSCSLGIVGYGAIGRAVAKLAEANGMTVGFFDPYVDGKALAGDTRYQFSTLDELLGASDVVTLHVPGTPGDPPIIAEEQLSKMRRGSYLINAARGSIISLAAVAKALDSGHLAGIAADVFEQEPPILDRAFLRHQSVLVTPHIAAITDEALQRMAVDVVNATLAALSRQVSRI